MRVKMIKIGVAIVIACLIVSQTDISQAGAEGVPVIDVQDVIGELGDVPPGKIVEHEFKVFNRGSAPLEIRKVKPG